MIFSDIYKIVRENSSFVVTSHIMPDGDSIGSVLAVTALLKRLGKTVFPVVNDEVPKKFWFLPGISDIQKSSVQFCDVVICLDCGDEERLGFDRELRKYGKTIVNIDHHKSNDGFGDINFVDSLASSTGEIIYRLITEKTKIDMDIALPLYTSIITDTGSIRYSNTSAETLRILAHLVEIGVKPDIVSREVFEKRSIESLKLLKICLNSLEFLDSGKIAFTYLRKSMLEEVGADEDDADGLNNLAREVEGVEVAVFFREKETTSIKVGLRSNGEVDVSHIAEEFNGGGHAKAAGCTLALPLEEARELLLDFL